jgi:DNA-binding MarR family transcriptional regulator
MCFPFVEATSTRSSRVSNRRNQQFLRCADVCRTTGAGIGSLMTAHREMDAVLASCRLLVAISARSVAAVADVVDPTQVRVLVITASRGPISLGELADAAGLTPSTTSRLCDRMVASGLLDRHDDPTNRRALNLTLTQDGRTVVEKMITHRRTAIEAILNRLPRHRRTELADLLAQFNAVGGEPVERDLWSMGWTTEAVG